jgi:hypothetical protein
MNGAQVVIVIGFENQSFRVQVNGWGSSSWLFEFGIFLIFFVSPDNSVDSLSCYLKIPSDLCN